MATADHNISKIQVKSDGQQPVVRHLNLTADRFGDIVDEENDLVISIYPPSLKRPQAWDLKEVTTMVESVYDLYAKLDKIATWLERCAAKLRESAGTYRDFPSLRESTIADAKNFEATAADIRKVMAKARGEK